jgi:conjugal transfer/entry exclusion protein
MSKAKEVLREYNNPKAILQDYAKKLAKLDDQLRKEYQVVSAEIKKVVAELDKQEDFSKVSKVISGLSDAQSDLAFYVKEMRTILLELEGED